MGWWDGQLVGCSVGQLVSGFLGFFVGWLVVGLFG